MEGLHAQYSRKAATQPASVARATNDTTFHCLPEAWRIHLGREREGAAGRGASSARSGGGLNSQSKSGCSEQDVGLLANNLPLGAPCLVKPLPGWVGWGLTNVAVCSDVC